MQYDFTEQNKAERITEINAELEKLDKKLKKPERTVNDLIRHIELLKELNEI
ncbi:MAG: hypothetical protein OSJ68_09020 [Clostridia bacterium]|nr:hypothetical protein [Clostridia bacterium]